MHFITRF